MPVKSVFVLGAGFSSCAGLPLQKDFADKILLARGFDMTQPSKIIVDQLETFAEAVFSLERGTRADRWPSWEDLFTCLDLAANTGHNLGRTNTPRRLRALRRAILSRIVRMLGQRYEAAIKSPSSSVKEPLAQLDHFLGGVDLQTSAFISLNWDTVLELRLLEVRRDLWFDYGPHVINASFDKGNNRKVLPIQTAGAQRVQVAKMHGAINWLYCDNCRRQFSFPPARTGSVARQIMQARDWEALQGKDVSLPRSAAWKCWFCNALLGTRIATFSYRKVLDSPMMLRAWFYAEDLLREAENWIFVGYSLPEADYEFKHFLKRIELARLEKPRLLLIDKCDETARRYQSFFGERIPDRSVCLEGLGKEAEQFLKEMGPFA